MLELGGNAVVGYRQQFDVEGDSGLVARAIGTVVSLADRADGIPLPLRADRELLSVTATAAADDDDGPDSPPPRSTAAAMTSVPLITMCKFPPGFITRLGATRCPCVLCFMNIF